MRLSPIHSLLIAGALAAGSSFLETYRPLARDLAQRGMVRGLSRTALKLTLPGVPDVYQGTEFWDLSLVDPDNRRAVDYKARARALDDDAVADGIQRHRARPHDGDQFH